jgi:hypothetical protein
MRSLMFGRIIQHVWEAWQTMTHGATPFGWFSLLVSLFVETLVLSIIVLFEGPKWRHEKQAKKKTYKLVPFLVQGEQLRSSISFKPDQDQN